jgi:hypothetical protein
VVAAVRGGEAERDTGARRGAVVAGLGRLVEDLLQLRLGRFDVLRKAELELGVRDSELTLVDVAQIAAGLEVLNSDPELARQHPKRLHRRRARASFDPGDVRVRDSRPRELSLREAALQAQPFQAHADRFDPRLLSARAHEPRDLFQSRYISQMTEQSIGAYT